MFRAFEAQAWPATDLAAFQALLLPLLFVPLAAIHADGHLPRRKLLLWLVSAALACALVGGFDGYRTPGVLAENLWEPGPLFAATAAGLFIAEALLLAAHADGRRVPRYATYFDAVAKHAVQVAAAAAFAGVLWILLYLGAELFKLITLTFFSELIGKKWFAIPITTTAVALAVHATDVKASLVHGVRTLALTLLSWLLPVLTAMAAAFVASLPFTGLQPLWDTRFAAALLLSVAASLIILINAAYQSGEPENQPRGMLQWAMTAAMALPAPLIAIAAYALFLRVRQYGWTADRVQALACVVVGSCFAAGYLAAVVRRRRLEPTNIAASVAAVAVLFSLFTPLADPVRISVASQVARLEDGRTSAQTFDYAYLRFEGGRYGAEALARMQRGGFPDAEIAKRAALAAALTRVPHRAPIDAGIRALNIYVTGDREFPASFLAQD